jgi:hypothetical protein
MIMVPWISALQPYTANGVQTVFPFYFKAMTAAEVQVITYSPSGAVATVDPSQYTVNFNTDNIGGSLVFNVAPLLGLSIHIWSNPDFSQDVDFGSQLRFDPSIHEDALDRSVIRDLWLRGRVDEMAGMIADLQEGIVTGGGAGTTTVQHEMWLDQFYTNDLATDTDALLAFAEEFNSGLLGSSRLLFPSLGRGPSGRTLIDSEILFANTFRLEMDFRNTTTRFTTPASKIRYSPGQILGSSSVVPTAFFKVRGGIHQFTTGCQYLFHWDFKYHPSRGWGTGYAEDMRFEAQDLNNAAHTVEAPFLCCNTWYFTARRCEHVVPNTGTNEFIEQHGVCIVARIDGCDVTGPHKVIEPGVAALVGVEGNFTTGTYARGKALRQGANIAYFGRNDGGYGHTYSLYDETGALVVGAADLLDATGAVVGSFNITSITRYQQCSEAVSVSQNSTFVGVDWFAQATAADFNTSKFLNWNLSDMHISPKMGILDMDGISDVQAGSGLNFISNAAGCTCYIINNADQISLKGGTYTTGALGGKFHELTNIIGGCVADNVLMFFDIGSTTDNTVKNFDVHDNDGYLSAAFVNTGKRHNYTNTRGIRFRNNGDLGLGVDQDDLRKYPWVPAITGSGGNPTAVTLKNAGYVLGHGRLTMTAKLELTNTAGADGTMYISLPAGLPVGALFDSMAVVSIGNLCVPGFIDAGNTRIVVPDAGGGTNSVTNGFKQGDVLLPNLTDVYFSVTLAVEYD